MTGLREHIAKAATRRVNLSVHIASKNGQAHPFVCFGTEHEEMIDQHQFESLVKEARDLCGGQRTATSVPEPLPIGVVNAVIRWHASDLGGDRGAFCVSFAFHLD